jgi:hypothetical protein
VSYAATSSRNANESAARGDDTRRLKAADLSGHFSPHSFRVTTVTDLLEQNVPLKDAHLRPAAAQGDAEHRRADLDLTGGTDPGPAKIPVP